jgi:putative glycosyltransferase (TIGR04372 family)
MINRNIWNKFLSTLQRDGINALFRALVYFGFRFLGLILALPSIIVLWILKPFFWLRVGKLNHARIGRLALDTDFFLRQRQLGQYSDDPFYCFLCDSRGLANRQLLVMFQRILPLCESRVLVALYDGILPILKNTPFHQPLILDEKDYPDFNKTQSSIQFTPDEIQKGRELLRQMNVDFENDDYVCIFARDNAFLEQTQPYNSWDYLDCYNADIDTYKEAVKYLNEKGLTVIRVGSIVNKPISYSHARFIDYSISNMRSDFLDIFLVANCKFFLGTDAGLAGVAVVADVPRVSVNYVKFGYQPYGKQCLYIPKKYKFLKTREYVPSKEAIAIKLDPYLKNLSELNLELEDNSPQDILLVTREMMDRLDGTFNYSLKEERLVEAFNESWAPPDASDQRRPTPIGIEWLKKNKDLYFPE